MKAILPFLMGAALLLAQTPATTKAPAKAPAKALAKAPAKAPSPSPRLLNPALAKAKAPELYRVKFTTTKGDFVIEVARASAPLGADRFYNLVKIGFFTNVSFYRVLPSLVQFGASPYPTVADAWSKAPIQDEPVKQSNTVGAVTFAKGGPNSRTTQVFINLEDNTQYDAMGFGPFGKVTEGMDVVKSLYNGYGDMAEMGGRGPSQGQVMKEGKAYLDKSFPQLDSIKLATVIFPEAAPAAARKGVPAKKAAPAATKK